MDIRAVVVVSAALLMAAGCATAVRYTLQDRFRAIGLAGETADCMVGELEQRLSQDDLQDLAQYTFTLARADSNLAAIRALMSIDNPRAVSAVGKSGVTCVTGFRL